MDGKRLKEFITKRSTIWTLSFCMTGIIVLGSIASLERAQRSEIQQETEAVPGEQALADDLTAENDSRMQGDVLEGADEEQALADGADGNADDLAAANADGMADGEDGQTGADGNTDASVTANADGTADGSDGSGLGSCSVFLVVSLPKIKYTRNNKCGIDENTDFLKGVRRNEGYHKKANCDRRGGF